MEDSTYRLISLSGFFVISGIAWVTGTRTKIKIETIVGSIFLAWTLGALTFWFSGSRAALEWINDLLIALLSASQKGSIFLFGPLALSPGQTLADGSSSIGFVLAFQVFPSVIFFRPCWEDYITWASCKKWFNFSQKPFTESFPYPEQNLLLLRLICLLGLNQG